MNVTRQDLWKALLALDSYHREGSNLENPYKSSYNMGSKDIGNVSFLSSVADGDFYAQAYELDGKIIIF